MGRGEELNINATIHLDADFSILFFFIRQVEPHKF